MRCEVLTLDSYTNRLFFIKSAKGYVQLPYSTVKTSLISHYSASLVFQNNLGTSAGKTKTKITDHSFIGKFYQNGLFFPQRLHDVHATLLDCYNFSNQILLKVPAYILQRIDRFQNHPGFFGGFQVERRQARVGPEVQVIPLDTCVENLKQKLISFQVKPLNCDVK